jgi:hypothetical protein
VLTALLVSFACFLTWPQCLYLATRVASHDDGFFSPWRVAWIAHALRTDPSRLYDANIFYPDRGTLANSDAVILEGALGSPFLWAGRARSLSTTFSCSVASSHPASACSCWRGI